MAHRGGMPGIRVSNVNRIGSTPERGLISIVGMLEVAGADDPGAKISGSSAHLRGGGGGGGSEQNPGDEEVKSFK